jgi:L-alanine-DL-glutamate epimerase-like enolase superfamily enzyme
LTSTAVEVAIERLDVSVYEIPTDEPETDGTLEWDSTTVVVVEAHAGGRRGVGYTYGHRATGVLIEDLLAPLARDRDALDPEAVWHELARRLRNTGRPGIGFMALSAVDTALWDLRARLQEQPLVALLGRQHETVPLYGSGGFTSYSNDRLAEQLGGWVDEGIPRVKMKVGREPERDRERLDAVRAAIGDADLYVDANGAFDADEAIAWSDRYREWNVQWFEEPVSSAELAELRRVRQQAPQEIAAGEYGYVLADFRNLLDAEAVGCLQADVTRCGGITGLRQVAALAEERGIDLSAHCAPALSTHPFAAVARLRHLEYFHDHVRIEALLFEGVSPPEQGALRPHLSRPGNGLELRRADAERFAV